MHCLHKENLKKPKQTKNSKIQPQEKQNKTTPSPKRVY